MLLKLTDRIAWAIQIIKSEKDFDKGISNLELAKRLGTNKDTLAGYMHGRGLLKGEVIEKIVELYNFSPQWLFKNEGEPFPGARNKYKEVCGPDLKEEIEAAPVQGYRVSNVNAKYQPRGQASAVEGIDVEAFRQILDIIKDIHPAKNRLETTINYEIALILQKIYRPPIDKDSLTLFLKALHECGEVYKGKGLLAPVDYAKLFAWGRKRKD